MDGNRGEQGRRREVGGGTRADEHERDHPYSTSSLRQRVYEREAQKRLIGKEKERVSKDQELKKALEAYKRAYTLNS